jgi:hypothetical protein
MPIKFQIGIILQGKCVFIFKDIATFIIIKIDKKKMAKRYKQRNYGYMLPKKGFPTFATLLFIIGVLWLLTELKLIKFEIPWWPVVLIVVAIGLLSNRKK